MTNLKLVSLDPNETATGASDAPCCPGCGIPIDDWVRETLAPLLLADIPRHRTPHIGKSRYEAIAEYHREYYNRASELILSDTVQSHPFLSGAEDFCKSDNTLSVGPGYILPMIPSVM